MRLYCAWMYSSLNHCRLPNSLAPSAWIQHPVTSPCSFAFPHFKNYWGPASCFHHSSSAYRSRASLILSYRREPMRALPLVSDMASVHLTQALLPDTDRRIITSMNLPGFQAWATDSSTTQSRKYFSSKITGTFLFQLRTINLVPSLSSR